MIPNISVSFFFRWVQKQSTDDDSPPKVFIPVGHALFSLFLNRSGYPQEEGTLLWEGHPTSPEII